MSFRFWRRVRLAPGVTLNLSKSTASVSFGPRGAKYTISPRGNRSTVGLPGTGLFYTVHDRPGGARVPQRDRLSLGFFRRLVMPADERGFVDGLRALNDGKDAVALQELEAARALPDAAWMAGMLRLQREDLASARAHLTRALEGRAELGVLYAKYGIDAQISLPVTDEITAHVRPRERGTRLALVEIAQAERDPASAMGHIEALLVAGPGDPVVVLSFAELALDTPGDRALMERVVEVTAGHVNETPVDAAVLLYRARALVALGLREAAIKVLTLANRRRKDRPVTLMRQIRYDRAVLHEQMGRRAQARRAFERLYAEDPGFADLRDRLALSPSPSAA